VAEYCKANGVSLVGAYGDISGQGSANLTALSEVAVGVETCVREGVPLPPIIKLFAPTTINDDNTFGYYSPSQPNAIHINSQLDKKRVEDSQKTGWAAGKEGSIVVHEAAHAAHDRVLRSHPSVARGDQLGHSNHGVAGLSTEAFKGSRATMIASAVSRYATTEPAEFVAETYTAHVSGRMIPDRLWKLYRKYGGPTPPGGYPDED
jgi:hypothetical protein